MGKYRDSSLFFIPDDPDQVFNGLTTGHDYVVPYDQGMVIAGSVSAVQAQSVGARYPFKVPMEATRGWKYLTRGFLHEEMSTDIEVRNNNWHEAQRVYCSLVRGDVRIVADFSREPPDGFLRRELIPMLLMRPDEVTSINRLPPGEFLRQVGWDDNDKRPLQSAKVLQFRRPEAVPA